MMRRFTWSILLCSMTSVLMSMEGGNTLSVQQHNDATWQPHAHPATVERHLTAFTRPVAEMALASEVSGKIITIEVAAGDRITDADPIVSLDQRQAEAAVSNAQAGVREAQAQLLLARAELALTRREQEWWQAELQRVQALVAEQRAPAREADELRYRRDSAQLRQQAASQRHAAAQAILERAQAALDEAVIHYDRHHLQGPQGWIVAERLSETGSVVSPGQSILALVDVRHLELPLTLSTKELEALRKHDSIPIQVAGQRIAGQLQRVDPRFDPHTRKRRAWLRFDARDIPDAGGGIEAQVRLRVPDDAGGVRIPKRFAYQDMEQWLVVDQDGVQHPIMPLRTEGDGAWLIVEGSSLPDRLTLHIPQIQRDQQ